VKYYIHPLAVDRHAVRARPKRAAILVLFVRLGNIERVALTVAEPVHDALAHAAVFVDDLLERFRPAPVLLEVLLPRDSRRLFASADETLLAERAACGSDRSFFVSRYVLSDVGDIAGGGG